LKSAFFGKIKNYNSGTANVKIPKMYFLQKIDGNQDERTYTRTTNPET